MASVPVLHLQGVTRRFGAQTVLDGIDIAIAPGSFTVLLGASGCGKSTSLRIMAGLDQPDTGKVMLEGKDVAGRTAYQRNVAMVFQSYALYPHLTVAQNIALPLTMRHMSVIGRLPVIGRLAPSTGAARKLITDKVETVAAMLGLTDQLHKKPGTLSGGQKQRVALGRALVRDPSIFLLDEPLSNLDARLRVRMRSELVALHKMSGRPFVYVTHDQSEAMAMADQIVVMIAGRVAQAGDPRTLYDRPASRDVAAFIGTNAINFFEADDGFNLAPDHVVAALRPEHLAPVPGAAISGVLENAEFLGTEILLTLRSEKGKQVRAVAPPDYPIPAAGTSVALGFEPRRLHHFDALTGLRLEPGQ